MQKLLCRDVALQELRTTALLKNTNYLHTFAGNKTGAARAVTSTALLHAAVQLCRTRCRCRCRPDCRDYFAQFNADTLTATAFAQLEALQGRRDTFFTSSLRSFESQEMVVQSATDIVNRYF
jgi:hypothetical protein